MMLPGGLVSSNGIQRTFSFKPLTGLVELAIAEEVANDTVWPNRISRVLTAALDYVGTKAAEFDLIHDLTVGDRQFLVMKLGEVLSSDVTWITRTCLACNNQFDVPVQNSRLPVKQAGAGYPYASVKIETVEYPIRIRLPTGRDQEVLQTDEHHTDMRQFLTRRLIADDSVAHDVSLTEEDLDRIESAVEEVCPEVATKAIADCPECQKQAVLELDFYACLQRSRLHQIFEDVDRLATHYHWSEKEILSLPRERRRTYLRLIERTRGWRDAIERSDRIQRVATP